ncbi:putative citrate lyase subunit beta, partial [Pseudomonas savastanoi pv. glycinea]|uniref:aldolase/citrate lyase family protein n=1 Tax=Pseudomonas savastanoi TaxID=29438 RepID=UPI000EFFD535
EWARNNCISILKTQAMKPICARINSPQTHEGMSDLMAIKDSGIAPDIIIIPKANILLDGHLVYCMLKDINPAIKIYVLVESISGLSEIRTIASVPSYIAGTLFGSADFLADMCISPSDSDCSWARQELAVQARRLGIEAIDTPCFNIKDTEVNFAHSSQARSYGYSGKQAVHPSQISIIHSAFDLGIGLFRNVAKYLKGEQEAGQPVQRFEEQVYGPPLVRFLENRRIRKSEP